jgi:hypothetical protein
MMKRNKTKHKPNIFIKFNIEKTNSTYTFIMYYCLLLVRCMSSVFIILVVLSTLTIAAVVVVAVVRYCCWMNAVDVARVTAADD